MATITEKLADLAAQSAQWIEWLERGLITFDGYQEKMRGIEAAAKAVTGSLEAMTVATEKVSAKSGGLAVTGNLFGPPAGWEESSQKQAQQEYDHITKLIQSGNQQRIDDYVKMLNTSMDTQLGIINELNSRSAPIEQWVDEQKTQIDELQARIDSYSKGFFDNTEEYRLSGQKAKDAAIVEELQNEINRLKSSLATTLQSGPIVQNNAVEQSTKAYMDEIQRKLDRLENASAAQTTPTPAKTYEIKFTTAAGQTKTLTTTQNPEEFLAALETAQRSAR